MCISDRQFLCFYLSAIPCIYTLTLFRLENLAFKCFDSLSFVGFFSNICHYLYYIILTCCSCSSFLSILSTFLSLVAQCSVLLLKLGLKNFSISSDLPIFALALFIRLLSLKQICGLALSCAPSHNTVLQIVKCYVLTDREITIDTT